MFENIDKQVKDEQKEPGEDKKEEANHSSFASLEPSEKRLLKGNSTKPTTQPQKPIAEFEKHIRALIDKGRRRGRRYSIIGIVSSVVICVCVLYAGYYLLSEIKDLANDFDEKQKKQEEMFFLLEDPKNICQSNYCCLSSLKRIKRNNYLEVDEKLSCPVNYKVNKLKCEGTLSWCEPDLSQSEAVNEKIPAEEDIATTSEELISSPIKSSAMNDADSDGLTDEEELEYGTEIDNPDTDGDGFSDGDEVGNGFNPTGEGEINE